MTINDIHTAYDEAVDVIQNIQKTRAELHSNQFTQKLFDELNGEDRGFEKLIGKAVFDIDSMSAMEQLNLREEIFAKLEESETEAVGVIRAALECYSDNLIEIIQNHDAHFDGNAKIRGDLRTKVADMSNEAKTAFADAKVDCLAFSYTNALAVIDMIGTLNKFLNSDKCNLERLIDLSTRQGGDMTDEDHEFIKKINDAIEGDVCEKQRSIWRAVEDRLVGAKVSALGFDADKLVEIASSLSKAEDEFVKTVRTIREALVHDDMTNESVVIKNSEYTCLLSCLSWHCKDMHRACEYLGEQVAVMSKLLELSSEPPKKEEGTEDKTSTEEDPNKDKGEDNNAGGEAEGNPA